MEEQPRFRTIRASEPKFESGNLRHITLKSAHLKGRGNISVYVPPYTDATDLPIVLLLHGVYGSALSWSQLGGAHHTAHRLINEKKIQPMLMVMPSDGLWGDGSGYVAHNGYNFEKWITEDVLDAVRQEIPQAAKSTTTFISGLSMGGFGTLHLGGKYPHLFKAISAHSAITAFRQMELFVEEPLADYQPISEEDADCFLILRKHKDELPPLRFDCGRDDLLIEYNRKLHQQLKEEGIPHHYEEFDGGHEWPYWEKHLEDTLLFFESHV